MAAIYKRKNKDGSEVWRVVFRRKDIKTLCVIFNTYEEALKWASENEYNFMQFPEIYLNKIKKERLRKRRDREFKILSHEK